MNIFKSALSLVIAASFCSCAFAEDIRSFGYGDYLVKTSFVGEMGSNDYRAKVEVFHGDKVVYSQVNPTGLDTVKFYPELAVIKGDCLNFVYAEAGDGLDDDYLHYVQICGDAVSDFKFRIDKQSGVPELVFGEMPASLDKEQVESSLRRAFELMYSDLGSSEEQH